MGQALILVRIARCFKALIFNAKFHSTTCQLSDLENLFNFSNSQFPHVKIGYVISLPHKVVVIIK